MPDQGEYRNSAQQDARIAEAVRHVEMGFAAFPCWSTTPDGVCRCGKPHQGDDARNIGKHPSSQHGFKDATTDPAKIRAMMSNPNEPNYGIAWPIDSPKGVVMEWDVDGTDWKAKIDALKAKFGPLPPTKTTRSPSGGLHIFYRWPDNVPVPDGNHLHGFIARWPGKGYVVGVGSRINGKTYTDVGNHPIADLPPSWAVTETVTATRPMITVTGDEPGYELPTSIETGGRHDAIAAFVASRWNRGITKAEIAASVRSVLVPLFVELMDDHRLSEEIEHAWDTCVKKWRTPGQTESPRVEAVGASGEVIEIDPLAVEMRIDRPTAMDIDQIVLPIGLVGLMEHYRTLCDAPNSSLLLASCVTMSALVGPKPTLRWRGTNRSTLFGVIVGEANYGRKGAAMRVVDQAFKQVDPLLGQITKGGIASPEKLIDLLRESKTNALGSLLIREMELKTVLSIASREGNHMSAALRQAWDGDRIESHSLARGSSVAEDYHTAFIAGITPGELGRSLTSDDIANGWANRFLWFYAEPRRDGAFDPDADDTMDPTLAKYLADCIHFARSLGGSMLIAPRHTMTMTPVAMAQMNAMVARLDVPPVGPIGVLRQRMPAHIVRIGMLSALFRQSAVIDEDDLALGVAMTSYAVESMRAVFGVRVDDDVAQMILGVLAQSPDGWLNTSTLSKLTRKEPARVRKSIDLLMGMGLITREDRKTGGRTAYGYRLGAF